MGRARKKLWSFLISFLFKDCSMYVDVSCAELTLFSISKTSRNFQFDAFSRTGAKKSLLPTFDDFIFSEVEGDWFAGQVGVELLAVGLQRSTVVDKHLAS